jgi:lambda family phage minor tail protein L
MQSLSLASALQKHQVAGTAPWFVLLDIYPNKADLSVVLRLARNTDDVIWQGNTYVAFNFDIQSIEENSNGQLPNVTIQVSNVNRAVQGQLEPYSGGIGATVVLTVVQSADLAGDPVQQFTWTILEAFAPDQWVTFTLGAPNPLRRAFPNGQYVKDHCMWRYNTPALQAVADPAGSQCGYLGAIATCDLTLNGPNGCRFHANQERFGGFPGIDSAGFRAASVV